MRVIIICAFMATLPLPVLAQTWQELTMPNAPHQATNAAVVFNKPSNSVFVFGGIDSTKSYTGINQNCYSFSVTSGTWQQLQPLPDTLGKIAAAASSIGCKIYHIGGYHVLGSGNEVSSSRLHIYNACSGVWESDGAPLPVPIDDHVQAVWRDSLIFVVTGWSTNSNVPDVQIYNASANSWLAGTAVPNTNNYMAFGASGAIVGDTLYYFGGARMGTNFPASNILRKGYIDPGNPQNITWQHIVVPNTFAYRSGCAVVGEYICWIGGSAQTYNYNGLAYAGGSGVLPLKRCLWYHVPTAMWYNDTLNEFPMDIRGVAEQNNDTKFIFGGMQQQQMVSSDFVKLTLVPTQLSHIAVAAKPTLQLLRGINCVHVMASADIAHIALYNATGSEVSCTWHALSSTTAIVNLPQGYGIMAVVCTLNDGSSVSQLLTF